MNSQSPPRRRGYSNCAGDLLTSPPSMPFGCHATAAGIARVYAAPANGGPLAFVDMERNLAFRATSNYQCKGARVGPRTEALVDATFRHAG